MYMPEYTLHVSCNCPLAGDEADMYDMDMMGEAPMVMGEAPVVPTTSPPVSLNTSNATTIPADSCMVYNTECLMSLEPE